jgi:uncharacterized protein
MDTRVSQHLRLQAGEYVIEHLPHGTVLPPSADWTALVRAPEGLTVVRRVAGTDAASEGRWVAFYSGQTAHALDLPGMLAALVSPLAQASIPVFVTSTYHADLIFVPAEHWSEAAGILRRAGHEVDDAVDGSAELSADHGRVRGAGRPGRPMGQAGGDRSYWPESSRALGSAGTSTECCLSAASGTISRARSWVEASTTGAALPS